MSLRIFFILIIAVVVHSFPQQQQKKRSESPVIFIDFNYEGAGRGDRSLDQVAYADGSRARTTFKDSYGNPVVYDSLEDIDAGRPSKNKNLPYNFVIPGYASGLLGENETPTRSNNFDNQEARRINDDRIHFVDPQANFFAANTAPLLPQLPTASSFGANKNSIDIPRPNINLQETPEQPQINDPLSPENIHLPANPEESAGVPATNENGPKFFRLLPAIDDPLKPHNIQLPNDPQKSEGIAAAFFPRDGNQVTISQGILPPVEDSAVAENANPNGPKFFRLLPAIDDPLKPHNIQLPADPQKSEGVAATFFQSNPTQDLSQGLLPPPNPEASLSSNSFQNDRVVPSISQGILPPIDDPLNLENINLPTDPRKSEGIAASTLRRDGISDGLEPPQLPNIDAPFNSNPFLPPAVNTFNHPKTSTFNGNNDGPVVITDDQISFAPRPSNGLQPPKDPHQDLNVNFAAPTVSTTKFTGSFTGSVRGNSIPTTQQPIQQIPVVVVQSPKTNDNKYKGSFGGPPGILSTNQFASIAPTQASLPQITSPTSSVTINRRFSGNFGGAPGVLGGNTNSRIPVTSRLPAPSTTQNTFTTTTLNSGNVIASVNKYQGNFGGPSGVLQPFDNKA